MKKNLLQAIAIALFIAGAIYLIAAITIGEFNVQRWPDQYRQAINIIIIVCQVMGGPVIYIELRNQQKQDKA